ncbi:uncharacterized protein KY384_005362 [Bacidia gigantensis]|uniref:uncharacterized protein n=1 Tax=Bacidia gigantensis TaxID=2732470 RepID=UPI001D039339|nr:uncharacterized protein KY384_005362 [Bacidia gigantensis]KAG8529881.1 hypothetical protein KY384_005362 [Bacidia gigantensis]
MLLEDQRFLHEDLERLEQGISDRVTEDHKHIRDKLNRDHQVAGFLTRIQEQSERLLDIYNDTEGLRSKEIQNISTGDPFDEFYKQLGEIKDFHRRYPNEPVENLERAYKRKAPGEGESATAEVDNLFTGEEAYGRFLDLTMLHEDYLNLNNIKRLSYLQYLQTFDQFGPPHMSLKRAEKRSSEEYFRYVTRLAEYLENFLHRTKPLQDLDKVFASIGDDFTKAWEADKVPEWGPENQAAGPTGPVTEGTGEGIWCADCAKEFKNDNVYKAHLTGKKHIKNAEARTGSSATSNGTTTNGASSNKNLSQIQRLKERVIAEREYRIHRLASTLENVRTDTRVNVERRQGMTERERQMELEAFFAEQDTVPTGGGEKGEDSDSDGDEKIYNPLKLPLAWDGKPIPYWLYKLHGLGVEFPCEVCGNFVYMGRRAFDKHFNEARHIYGLKCLGITNTALFREITGIQDALKLWDKIQRDKRVESTKGDGVVQMEDAEGNVMPEKVYWDLQKQGLL